jgi:hypothetical protein
MPLVKAEADQLPPVCSLADIHVVASDEEFNARFIVQHSSIHI